MKKIVFIALLALFWSCGSNNGAKLLPNVSGKAGEIIVVIDKDSWDGALGSQLRSDLGGDCPYLANREPLFNLANVPPGSFNNMFKMHRNILIMNINPQNQTSGMVYRVNEWAAPQSIAQVNAWTAEDAVTLVKENAEQIAEYFEQAERDRIIANAAKYEELSIRPYVKALTGGEMTFPSGYRIRKTTEDFLWVADEKQYTNQTVLIYKYPVTGEDFTKENMIARRNEFMKANVPGMMVETMWMTTSMAIEPEVKFLSYKGINFAEMRGFWEVTNDFMGGPFVSHSFYSPDGKYIIVTEAFVYAPRFDKRQYLRQVESLLYSFRWAED